MIDLRLGRWQDVLSDVTCDALIFDAPYSVKTHAVAAHDTKRNDGYDASGLVADYDPLTPDDVRAFCESWADRCRGWMVSITDFTLAPIWKAEMERVGRYAFAPVGCTLRGMSVRVQADGPSSWMLYAMTSRPAALACWGVLPGGYHGPFNNTREGSTHAGGRGKPPWLMRALVRDYSKPGDLVVDPFAGWGSTLLAARALNRRTLGAELDADAHAEASRRIALPLQLDLAEAMIAM